MQTLPCTCEAHSAFFAGLKDAQALLSTSTEALTLLMRLLDHADDSTVRAKAVALLLFAAESEARLALDELNVALMPKP